MDAIGAQKMFHSIDEVSKQPISSKLSCLLTFYYMDAHERHLCDSNLRFYLDRDINGLKIAMVEYQKVAFREMFENQPSVGAFEF